MSILRIFQLLALAIFAIVATGCAGEGELLPDNGGQQRTTALINIRWEEPSREIVGPTSAQSARITITHNTMGTTSYVVNRPAGGGVFTHSVPNAPVGTSQIQVTFYSQANATGSVVSVATGSITIQANGQSTPVINSQTGTVTSVTAVFDPSQEAYQTGGTATLVLTPLNAQGEMVANVDPAAWSVVSQNTGIATVTAPTQGNANWTVNFVGAGQTDLVVTLDGRTFTLPVTVSMPGDATVRVVNVTGFDVNNLFIGTMAPIEQIMVDSETGTFDLAPGTYTVNGTVAPGDEPSTDVTFGTFTIATSGRYNLVLYYDATNAEPYRVRAFAEDHLVTNDPKFRVTNLAVGQGPLDVFLTDENVENFTLTDRIAASLPVYGQTQWFTNVNEGFYTLWAGQPGTLEAESWGFLNLIGGYEAHAYIVDDPSFGPFIAVVYREMPGTGSTATRAPKKRERGR
jgi:hypothetical protein